MLSLYGLVRAWGPLLKGLAPRLEEEEEEEASLVWSFTCVKLSNSRWRLILADLWCVKTPYIQRKPNMYVFLKYFKRIIMILIILSR